MRPGKISIGSRGQPPGGTTKIPRLVPSTVTVPESVALSPRVRDWAVAEGFELLICAVPPLLVKASVEVVGTWLSQFVSVNQSPEEASIQFVLAAPIRAGKLQTAKARTMNRQIRADCDADLFFIRSDLNHPSRS